MWKCKNCGEENEADFGPCRGCDLSQDDVAPANAKEFQPMKEKAARSNNTTDYTSTYGTSRMIATFVSFVGWVVVGISALIILVSLAKSTGPYGGFALIGLFPALGGVVSGLFLVMTGQLTRATLNTADNTGQMLSLMKRNK